MPGRDLTPQIEPSIPFPLRILIKNIGYGNALDFTITSAQPQIIERVAGRPPLVNVDFAQKGDMRHTYADTSLAHADLGYAPTVGLEEGLAAEHQWLTGIL